MKTPLTDRDWETLSSYMDGELSSSDSKKIEQRLQKEPVLRSAMQELKSVKSILNAVPRRHAPRNFTLKPSMVEKRKISLPRLFPVFSFASALSILLIILSMFVQGFPTNSLSAAPAMVAAPQLEKTSGSSASGDSSQPPPIINWEGSPGVNNQALPYGKGGGGGGPDTLQSPAGAAPPVVPAVPAAPLPNAVEPPAPQLLPQPVEPQPTETAAQDNQRLPEAGVNPTPTQAFPAAPAAPAAKSMPSQSTAPPFEPTPAPTETTSIAAPTPAVPVAAAEPMQGNGPILGVPPADERGEIQPGQLITPEQAAPAPATFPNNWLLLQVILALVALITGAAAIGLWLKYKRERS